MKKAIIERNQIGKWDILTSYGNVRAQNINTLKRALEILRKWYKFTNLKYKKEKAGKYICIS